MDGSFDTAGFAEVLVPMTQGEIAHAPTIIQQDRVQQQHVEMSVEEVVPMTQEEIVQGPTIVQQDRIPRQQHVEFPVEVPVPMTQEEIVQCTCRRSSNKSAFNRFMLGGEAPIPIAQEVIVHVPTIINRHCHHHT